MSKSYHAGLLTLLFLGQGKLISWWDISHQFLDAAWKNTGNSVGGSLFLIPKPNICFCALWICATQCWGKCRVHVFIIVDCWPFVMGTVTEGKILAGLSQMPSSAANMIHKNCCSVFQKDTYAYWYLNNNNINNNI